MIGRLPPLNALRAFEAAARLASFKKAADELAVTPTAISHQIRLLEELLGVPLFVRRTRAVALTVEGEAMWPKLHEGFGCLAAAVVAVRGQAAGAVVTLCAPPSFAARWLVPRLGALARAHPEIDLRVSSSVGMVDGLERGNEAADAYDLAVRYGRGEYAGRQVELLFSPDYVAVCSPSLLAGSPPLRTPADLRQFTLIRDATVPEIGERPGWSEWLAAAGVDDADLPGPSPRFEDAALAVEAAIAGHGIALAARPLVSADLAVGRLAMPFAVAIPSRHAYYVTWSGSTPERPTAALMRDWLVRAAAAERAPPPRPRARKRRA